MQTTKMTQKERKINKLLTGKEYEMVIKNFTPYTQILRTILLENCTKCRTQMFHKFFQKVEEKNTLSTS
jgi:hypothetical protein